MDELAPITAREIKRGRPLTAGAPRSVALYLRVTPQQKEAMQRAADTAGESLTDWCRRRLLALAE